MSNALTKDAFLGAIIREQNSLIASGYAALILATDFLRDELPETNPRLRRQAVDIIYAAIEQIEEWRQKRDPAGEAR